MTEKEAKSLQCDGRLLLESMELSTLKKMMDAVARSQGIAAGIFTTDYKRIVEPSCHSRFCELIRNAQMTGERPGDLECRACDQMHFPRTARTVGPYSCHAGLVDFSVPIVTSQNVLIGAIFGGQVLLGPPTREDFEKWKAVATRFGIDELDLFTAATRIPRVGREKMAEIIQLCEGIAATIADLVEKKASEHSFLMKLISTLDLETITGYAIDYVHAILRTEACSIFLHDKQEGELVFRLINTSSPTLKPRIGHAFYRPGEGLTGWVAQSGKPLNIADLQDAQQLLNIDPPIQWLQKHLETADPSQMRCFLAVPLVSEAQRDTGVIGVIRTIRLKGEPFSEADMGTLHALANLIVTAVESNEVRQRLQRKRDEWQALGQAARAINSGLDLEAVLDSIIENGLRVMSYKGGTISLYVLLFDKDAHEFVVLRGGGEGFRAEHLGRRFPGDRGIAGQVRETGSYYVAPDVATDGHYQPVIEGLRSAVVVPILSGKEVLGTLSMGSSHVRSLDEDDARLLQGFAEHVSIALNNALGYARARSQLHVQKDAVDAVIAQGGVDQVCRAVVEVAQEALMAAVCSLFLYDGEKRLILTATTDRGLEHRARKENVSYELGQGLTGWVAKNRQVLRLADISNAEGLRAISPSLRWLNKSPEEALDPQEQRKTFMGAPIQFSGELLGVIRVAQRKGSAAFLPADEAVLRGIADQAAVAIRLATSITGERLAIRGFGHDAAGPAFDLREGIASLRMEQGPSPFEARLEDLHDLATHLTHMVATYTAIAGSGVTKMSLQGERAFSVASIVDRAFRIVRGVFGEKDTKIADGQFMLSNQIPPDIRILGDEGKLYSIFFNLIMNAMRHAESRVIVSTIAAPRKCVFEVMDDGRGFDFVAIPRQLPAKHLGLYIAQRFAGAHDGRIRLRACSGDRQGTRAIVEFPFSRRVEM